MPDTENQQVWEDTFAAKIIEEMRDAVEMIRQNRRMAFLPKSYQFEVLPSTWGILEWALMNQTQGSALDSRKKHGIAVSGVRIVSTTIDDVPDASFFQVAWRLVDRNPVLQATGRGM